MPLFSVGSPIGRATQKVAGSPAFAKVAPHVVPPVDRVLHRLTGGRVLLSRGLLPGLVLTTTGRRSGLPRTTPLMCVPEPEGTFLVVGSNFGRDTHPAWTGNLLAAPAASISYGRRDVPVTAELLEGGARDDAWARALRVWPTFDAYQGRVDRQLRVFRLHPRR
ncbi:nitroreductase family deazaflavin-dependent oxidoreductase [Iamia sp. SCSIO 61187]|uniref:nitroreductase family deazaflavin-dependent oxidoreductase n=1 Tax=Iamia sp. SCSIO 61187 TaxID=2722752 RepID=UPI001C6396DD|nr:nitroreductase family deazaflavin-dependent oxidoreductase [Iamia sp. SCSIO 61187]QYG92820.1 nitroreductase family deazaflavin-dependent oxidoreductase [Iamia sp. SCSIO 61187]